MSSTNPPDFRTLLQTTNLDDVQRPKVLPTGTYKGTIIKFEYGQSSQKQTPYVRYFVRPDEARDDVDQEALEGINLSQRSLRRDFFLTADALYRLKEFLEGLGIETAGQSLGALIPLAVNHDVLISVIHREGRAEPGEAPEVYAEVASMKPFKE